MAGLDDRTFAWTHRGIAEYLGKQWAQTPHGPHCENTKSWPFCLSAAGLGLQLTDATLGTRHALGLRPLGRGHVQEEVHGLRRARQPEVGRALLRSAPRPRARAAAARSASSRRSTWCRRTARSASCSTATRRRVGLGQVVSAGDLSPARDPRPLTLGTCSRASTATTRPSAGSGASSRASRTRASSTPRTARTRTSSATSSSYGEPYPRGQESALYLLKDLLDGEGDWWRAFNEPDREKFSAPTVTDVRAIRGWASRVARNDPASGVLELESYAASSSARGEATRFSVRNLPDPAAVRVRRDGAEHAALAGDGAGRDRDRDDGRPARYEIFTGYRGGGATSLGEQRSLTAGATPGSGLALARGRPRSQAPSPA